MHFYAEAATKVRGAYQELPSTLGPAYGMVIRRPMGVCAAITPYNFPLTLLGTKVAPALASGNTVVAKPAATTPLATLQVARLFSEAGLPDGVLNVVTGRGRDIGDALVQHPDVRRIAFTGSTAVGRHVAGLAAPDLKRLTLELGGSDPVIICADADVDAAVKAVIIGRYWNAGQACLGCKRVFVHDSVYDDFVGPAGRTRRAATSRATARSRPRSRSSAWGRSTPRPAATSCSSRSRTAISKRRRAADRRRDHGAREGLVPRARGDRRAGQRLATHAPRRCSARSCRCSASPTSTTPSREPTTPRTASARALWTHDARLIHRAAQEIESGMTWVNQIHYGYDELPFGGVKASGYGKEHGIEALDSYVEIKSVVVGGLN